MDEHEKANEELGDAFADFEVALRERIAAEFKEDYAAGREFAASWIDVTGGLAHPDEELVSRASQRRFWWEAGVASNGRRGHPLEAFRIGCFEELLPRMLMERLKRMNEERAGEDV